MIQITDETVAAYRRDGAVLIKGLFADWVDVLAAGIERNLAEPGPYAAENLHDGEAGRFFDDYCNWTRIPEFERVIRESGAELLGAPLAPASGVAVGFKVLLACPFKYRSRKLSTLFSYSVGECLCRSSCLPSGTIQSSFGSGAASYKRSVSSAVVLRSCSPPMIKTGAVASVIRSSGRSSSGWIPVRGLI